jgi:UDP:flavonoid glycosyltransferase YjiC (YdhE family)
VADNPFWGTRVEQLGIGVHERFADLDRDRLEAGLRHALRAEVIIGSRAFGDAMRADAGAAGRAADLIEDKSSN